LLEISDKQQVNFSELKKSIKTNIENIILFGIETKQLDLQFRLPNYHKLIVNHINYLNAEDLTVIANNNAKKKALWTALQTMF